MSRQSNRDAINKRSAEAGGDSGSISRKKLPQPGADSPPGSERTGKICRCGAKASAAVAISGCCFKSLQFGTRVFLQNSKRLPVSLALVLKLTDFTVSTKSSGSGGINEESQKRFQSEGGKRVVPGRRRAAEASLISQRLPNSQQSPSMNFP